MNPVVILLPAFLISLVALAVFIWSMHRGVFGHDTVGARVIFAAHEVGPNSFTTDVTIPHSKLVDS